MLLELLWSFFQIGLFSIGGGYAALPIIEYQMVNLHGWLSQTEFADVVTISQMTPGPIAINAATFVGIKIAGIPGAVIATFGCILPSCIIALILAYLYYKYRKLAIVKGVLEDFRPGIAALIASAGFSIIALVFWGGDIGEFDIKNLDYIAVGIFAVCLFILQKFKPDPILIMLAAGGVGFLLYYFL